jgi:CubicO group peptidase (beta-lactamase class C family)
MRQTRVPGASIGVLCDGQTQAAGFGVTSLDNPLPVEPTTLFQIGSITKTFTGMLVMGLVEAGKLNLDAPVRSLLPAFRVADEDVSAQATIRHLLAHTGGWLGDFFIETGGGAEALARYVARMAELPQVAPLGLHYTYNNSAFPVLGLILEQLEGKPFESILRDRVLGPLRLDRSCFWPEEVMIHRFVVGHRVEGDQVTVAKPWGMPRGQWPMGGLASTVEDLLRYAAFHMHQIQPAEGEPVLQPSSVDAMHARQAWIWGEKEAIGLTWHLKDEGGITLVGHGGATNGQIALLEFAPQRAFALAVLTNADTGRHLVRTLRTWCLREYLGIDAPDPTPIEVPLERMKECEGRYVLPKVGYTDIGVLGGRLIGQDVNLGGFPTEDTPPDPDQPPYTLAFTEPDRMMVADGKFQHTTCELLRDEHGALRWLRIGGRIHLREPIA